jgi:hypothetical protein
MMNARTRKVLLEALELPSEERSELARELLESLRDAAAPQVEQAWAEVIARRAREVLDGTAATRDLDEGLDSLVARAAQRVDDETLAHPHRFSSPSAGTASRSLTVS